MMKTHTRIHMYSNNILRVYMNARTYLYKYFIIFLIRKAGMEKIEYLSYHSSSMSHTVQSATFLYK